MQAFDISNHGVLVGRTINEHQACRKNKIHMMKLQSILLIFTQFTLPETNIFAPENRPLEKEIPMGNHRF